MDSYTREKELNEWDFMTDIHVSQDKFIKQTPKNYLLEVMEDRIKLDLTDSLKQPNKHEKKEYMELFKIQLNTLLKQHLLKIKDNDELCKEFNRCKLCCSYYYGNNCYHICQKCNRGNKVDLGYKYCYACSESDSDHSYDNRYDNRYDYYD
jgi:hypothetical protein